jgi:hypothetical protein
MTQTMEQMAEGGSQGTLKADAYTPWYGIWTGAFLLWNFLLQYLDDIYNLYLAIVPIIFLPALILAGTLIISLVINVFRRRWRRTLSIIAGPIIAGALFVLLGRLGMTPEMVRLELSKSGYMVQIDALPDTDVPRLKCWNWGWTGGAAVVNIGQSLVYDESDQIALPQSSRSTEWIRKAGRVEKAAEKANGLCSVINWRDDGHMGVEHLERHFYVLKAVFE